MGYVIVDTDAFSQLWQNPTAATSFAPSLVGSVPVISFTTVAELHYGAAKYGSRHLLVGQGILSVESGALVVPACSGLVAASPVAPVGVVVGGFRLVPGGGEQACGFGDGQRDHAGFGWWPLVGCVRWRGLGVGPGPELVGGDRVDG